MFNIFNSNVLIGIGEAIGNVGHRLWRRRSHADEMDASFRRNLQTPIQLKLPDRSETHCKPEDIVIEAIFTVVEEEDEE
jgi:hypothetical protein